MPTKKTKKTKKRSLSTNELIAKMYSTLDEAPLSTNNRAFLASGVNHLVKVINDLASKDEGSENA